MLTVERHQILLVGLDDRLLWQLTRVLALWEERIGFRCAGALPQAAGICDRESIDLLVLDGVELAAEAGEFFGNGALTSKIPAEWIVLADSMPPGGFVLPGASARILFIEKPFNPKEFPMIVVRALTGRAPEAPEAGRQPRVEAKGPMEEERERARQFRTPAVVPDERYLDARAPAETGEKVKEERDAPSGDFYEWLARGFECLQNSDRQGALENWKAALALCPEDRRIRANIRRLESLEGAG